MILARKRERPGSLPALTLLGLPAVPGPPRHLELEAKGSWPCFEVRHVRQGRGSFHHLKGLDPFGRALMEALFGKSIKRPKSLVAQIPVTKLVKQGNGK